MDPRLLKRKAQYKTCYEHEWFYRLNVPTDFDDPNLRMKNKRGDTGLFGYYGQDIKNTSGIILARDVMRKKRDGKFTPVMPPGFKFEKPKTYKQFAFFESIESAMRHIEKWPQEERHFYELIGGINPRQKPYFDLDITMTAIIEYVQRNSILKHLTKQDVIKSAKTLAEEILMDVVSIICYVFLLDNELELDLDDISIYETPYVYDNKIDDTYSSELDVENFSPDLLKRKYSYHVVIQSHHFSNHEGMREFGQKVRDEYNKFCHEQEFTNREEPDYNKGEIDDIERNYKYIIDDIWHSSRQLRLLGSSKAESKTKKGLYILQREKLQSRPSFTMKKYTDVFYTRLIQSNADECSDVEKIKRSFVSNIIPDSDLLE